MSLGELESARALEDFVPGVLAKAGHVFYRFAPPEELCSEAVAAPANKGQGPSWASGRLARS